MEGKYDITIEGKSVGTLTVGKEGAYTVFEARCQLLQGLTRLSVYGQGREGYLGLLMPGQGEMLMKKRLSPGAMREFPKKIEFVGQAGGMETKEEKEEEKEEALPAMQQESEPQQENGPFWYASPDGALVSSDNGREMVALPIGDRRVPKNIPGESRVIEGKEYLVYITKEVV